MVARMWLTMLLKNLLLATRSFYGMWSSPLVKPLDLTRLYTPVFRMSTKHSPARSTTHGEFAYLMHFLRFASRTPKVKPMTFRLIRTFIGCWNFTLQDGTVPNIQETIRPFLLSLVLPNHIFYVSPHTVHPKKNTAFVLLNPFFLMVFDVACCMLEVIELFTKCSWFRWRVVRRWDWRANCQKDVCCRKAATNPFDTAALVTCWRAVRRHVSSGTTGNCCQLH